MSASTQNIHFVVSKTQAEVLTSLGIQGSWEDGFHASLEFCEQYQLGMPIGTTSLMKGYCYQKNQGDTEWRIVKPQVLTLK